jgi:nucleotide-binding universal stress UspA family protein
MSVAVAHQPSATGQLALREAARQAGYRNTRLTVIHIADTVDLDLAEAHTAKLRDDVATALAEISVGELDWDLALAPGDGVENTAATILELAEKADAELLVIGARRRSPVGKALLGSVAQSLILDADIPVLVVK